MKRTMNPVEALHKGLNILFKNKDQIDFVDTDISVIHKTAMLSSAPEHSNSVLISVATEDEIPEHNEILSIEGWGYEYPYYCFYKW